MGYLEAYHRKVETERKAIPEMVFNLLILNAGNIATEVRRRWIIGESIDGGLIINQETGSSSYASAEYSMFKAQINPKAGGKIDLTLTGSLGEMINIREVGNGRYEIYSADSKYQKIGEKYGFEEFGLNDEQEHELLSELFTFAMESIFNKIWRA